MNDMFETDLEIDILAPNTDTSFMMQNLIEQPLDASYPPVKIEFDYLLVRLMIDKDENIDEYIDHKDTEAMQRTLSQFHKDHQYTGKLLTYETIIEMWG